MGPFEEHLRDAIRINRERSVLYSNLSQGETKWVSRILIFSEIMTLPTAKLADLWGSYFIRRGIPIMKEEFIDMRFAREFSGRFETQPEPLSEFKRQSAQLINQRITFAWRQGGFEGVRHTIENELSEIQTPRTYHHMLRHLLESMLRIATLAPLHEAHRLKLGVAFSTLPLSKFLFRSHLMAIPFCTFLDSLAAPLHAKGISIIADDVPPIPARSDFYKP